jgi:tetratricopeptide (TPR) repeat protein
MSDVSVQPEATGAETRAALEARIAAQLAQADEATLQKVVACLGQPAMPPSAEPLPAPETDALICLNRRQFLGAVAAGGVALVATNAATAFLALGQGDAEGAAKTRAELFPQLTRLRELLALYEQLEKVGLDNLLKTGMAVIGVILSALRNGARLLSVGLDLAEAALGKAELALGKLQEAVKFVDELIEGVNKQLEGLWKLLSELTGVSIPITQSISSFFKNILQRIPFGVGAKIQQAIDWIESVIAALPEALANIRVRLLKLLQDDWVDTTGAGDSLSSRLIKPVREQVLAPARQMSAEIENLSVQWETQITQPVQAALEKRETIRVQIAAIRREQNLM